MENFRYTLDKSSKKYNCPNCQKKTFVKYVNNETGNYLTEDLGRCDRESKCSYHKAPEKGKTAYLINFLSLESISNKAYKGVDENGVIHFIPKSQILDIEKNRCWLPEWFLQTNDFLFTGCPSKIINSGGLVNTPIPSVEPPKEPTFHSLELLNEMYYDNPVNDNLLEFLKTQFTAEEVFQAMQKYLITGINNPWPNSTVFWQIDQKERIRGGKIMLYNASNSKRVKEPYNHINWVHKARKEEGFTLNQCLFGLHLVSEDYDSTIAIVESEKTAVIMSIFLPQFLWLATGNKQNLKQDLLKPIKKRQVVLYPDNGEFEFWNNKAEALRANGFNISVSDFLEKPENKLGFDLADLFLKQNQLETQF
jgi:hypothetical protein